MSIVRCSGRLQRSSISLIGPSLCLFLIFSLIPPVVFCQKGTAPNHATPSPIREEFQFGKVDLELLDQVDLLDRRYERDGLVFEDAAANAYLSRIGELLVPKGLVIENVTWKFRALRDPQPNAFA